MSYNNPQNAAKIDQYIKENPNCQIPKTSTIVLQGIKKDLQSYRLPIEITFYNIKNGRFAAEYIDLVKKEGRELDPSNKSDSKSIQSLLIELDPKQSRILEKDIQQYGQKELGIITYDGYVINGNRRRSVLEELSSLGHSEFKFIEVTRLPPNVSSQDLWKIEAGIQLSKNVQLGYDPINELLKFKEGFDAGLTPKEIANSLYGGFKEKHILEKLEQLKLIMEYLRFIGEEGFFNRAKGIHEHFIDLRNVINSFKKLDPSPEELMNAKRIGFQLIHDGVPQREIRKIKDMLNTEKIKKELWEAVDFSKPEKAGKKRERKIQADKKDEFTPARTVFNNCVDSVKALSESEQPERGLRRALKNLENIEINSKTFENSEVIILVDQIEKIIKNLKNHIQK